MSQKIVMTDSRAPIDESTKALTELFPRGAFVAWNGPQEDGFSRRAIVISHADDDQELTVLDGPDEVTLTRDDLASAVVLAESADKYGQRVSVKAKALGRTHGWCEVASDALEELNSTPPGGEKNANLRVVVRTTGHYVVRPTRETVRRAQRDYDGDLVALFNDTQPFYARNGEFNYSYFKHVDHDPQFAAIHDVSFDVVDEFPGDEPADAASESAA